ncbi:unnamed protein product [Peronospora belbahrii]|uniref:DML1/Misato tubulin domain-containing protein n=1 Tax=Peronospora belbahrii TaxID=622444 RepID=A0AAU9KJK0_9STRA|nr:unnamed protein product [Peronospora belbahrii]CAH0520516.1 unnamed protein product [Peronospora belbahrii]
MKETLRLQFGTAATTIGTQWLALQEANGITTKPHVLSFEAKGRVRRQVQAVPKQHKDHTTWDGGLQVYDQLLRAEPMVDDGLWSWKRLQEHNLVEVDEFRSHMPLHNFYEGHAVSNGGNIGIKTLEDVEDRVRTLLEACDQLRLVQGLVDMDSSWGGLAHEVLTYVAEECPGVVIMMVGNDWSYPMATDDDDAIFRVAPIVRDQTKIEARKRINIASSVALLSEVSHLVLPLAMSSSSLPSTRCPQLRFDRSSCADVSTVVATALELSLSTHRGRSLYDIMEGVRPSMKVVELFASFPHMTDPTMLKSISDSITNEVNGHSTVTGHSLHRCSFLPSIQQPPGLQVNEDKTGKTYYQRLHFRGAFTAYSSLRSSIDNFSISTRNIALHWSDTSPLKLPATYRLPTLQNSSVDAISAFALSSRTGDYLHTIAQLASKSHKRTLFEFIRAGMSFDALEELDATLATMGDAYYTQ